MTLPANIRVNVRAPFPSRVSGTAFVTVAKANGVWTITPDYTKLALSGAVTSTQVIALQDTATGAWSYTPTAGIGWANGSRVVGAAGSVSVLSTDVILLFQKSPSGTSSVILPVAASRHGVPVIIKDLTGDAHTNPITVVPAGVETIDGFTGAAAAANGVAVLDTNYGSKKFYPLSAGGWFVL